MCWIPPATALAAIAMADRPKKEPKMQMTLTITAESPAEMVTVLGALQTAGVGTPVNVVAEGPKPAPVLVAKPDAPQQESKAQEAPKRGRPPKETKPEPKSQSTLKVVPKDEPKDEQEPEPKEPPAKRELSVMDVRAALTEFLAANSEQAAGELLKRFGHCERLSQLQPEFFDAVYAAAVTPVVKDAPSILDDMNDAIPDMRG